MNQSPAERILEDLFLLGMSTQRTQDIFGILDERKNTEVSQAKSELRDALLEQVIGEYEAIQLESISSTTDISEIKDMAVRDELRAEQRKALYKFFGGSDDR